MKCGCENEWEECSYIGFSMKFPWLGQPQMVKLRHCDLKPSVKKHALRYSSLSLVWGGKGTPNAIVSDKGAPGAIVHPKQGEHARDRMHTT